MKICIASFFGVILFYSFTCNSQQREFQLKVTNPNNFKITDAYVEIKFENSEKNFLIRDGNKVIPYQIISDESESTFVCLVLDFEPNEEKRLSVQVGDHIEKLKFPSRTYAELAMKDEKNYFGGKFRGDTFYNVTKIKVPSIHTDHDALFKYEGPGWESEKVGYRFYLDWRNAIDIFGKKKDQLLLAYVGTHDTVAKDDSYHSMKDWGMDIFKVGNSLGIGSYGMWQDGKVNMVSTTDSISCEITDNGPVKSEVRTNYYGWKVGDNKYDLESKLSITAGSRMTKNEISISKSALNIVTGLAKYKGTEFFKSDSDGAWSYIALYGKQTLVSAEDKLGIALFYRNAELLELGDDDLSYLVKLKPRDGNVEYYFCAAWEQEEKGIKSFNDFQNYLSETQSILNNPPKIKVGKQDK